LLGEERRREGEKERRREGKIKDNASKTGRKERERQRRETERVVDNKLHLLTKLVS
jgi:F0F1-type ATP synthase membrane subunit b/b'